MVVDLPEACQACEGTGAKDSVLMTCSTCSGQGQVRVRQQVGPFIQEAVQPCQDCGGKGKIPEQPCEACNGQGRELKSSTLRFTVPEGAEHGTRMRMRGKGEPAPQGIGEPGDLFIELEVEPHDWFERSGSDLIMSLPLGFADLLLGTSIRLNHLDGKPLVIKVPAHSILGKPSEFVSEVCPANEVEDEAMSWCCSNFTCQRKFRNRSRKALIPFAVNSDQMTHSQAFDDADERRRS